MTQEVWVRPFEEGAADQKALLGGKGAGLAEMTRIGLPVPPGFTITTEAFHAFGAEKRIPDAVWRQVTQAIDVLGKKVKRSFGDAEDPLLVSVRSGAAVSMPGMMDTVLNLGLNDETVKGLASVSTSRTFALDSYRRFISMYGQIVMGVGHDDFEAILEDAKATHKAEREIDLEPEALAEVVDRFKKLVEEKAGKPFPQDPLEQLRQTVAAVFGSWDNRRAATYRSHHAISDDLGTAVNVQAMVFGNRGKGSASGVAFTRNPSTGVREIYGEYLPDSQGEDVVAGIRTPRPISALQEEDPAAFQRFQEICKKLESHYRNMQDVEFTIEEGRLFMLQTRTGKRTATAAVQIAVDMVDEGIIDREEALSRIDASQVDQMLHTQIDPEAEVEEIATGLPASPGAATGKVVFHPDVAEKLGNEGTSVILVRTETTPDDIHGFLAAAGILTARGGMTSHAAVVARGMGKPCVAGCGAIRIDEAGRTFTVGDVTIKEGDVITLDGSTGRVISGVVATIEPELTDAFKTLLLWADEQSRMSVRANADTPEDASRARELGAVGIGLCRTEHMFLGPDRLPPVRRMILAEDAPARQAALDEILPLQRQDFEGIFRAMDGFPVTIRLIDPPLHEFLPGDAEIQKRLKEAEKDETARREVERMAAKAESLAESNPMLGFRGCRLGIVFPEIIRMQTRAIIQAACRCAKDGVKALPEIMVPLVGHVNELRVTRGFIVDEAQQVMAEEGVRVDYLVGTMIEVPRAALTADAIAKEADFFSFGTNDLTQMTFGYSRDDAEGRFLFDYLEKKILEANPFERLDRDGVGRLVKMAVEAGRSVRPKLKVGICGEHGGEPTSVEFCHEAGLDYVSCSPFRVPIARLAAAHAAMRERGAQIVDATV